MVKHMQPGTEHIMRPSKRGKTIIDKIKQAQTHSTTNRAVPVTIGKAPWEKEENEKS